MAKKKTKRKQKTELQKAYQKERRRLQSAKRRAEKQGYVFPENVIPDMPKRVTRKALEKIQQTKPKDLYEKAKWISETGEEKPALERREEVKKRGYEKRTFLAIERKRRERLTKQAEQEAYNKAHEQEQEQGEEPYYPTFSLIDRIREMITGLTREVAPNISIDERKSALLNILDDTVSYYSMHNALPDLENYYSEHIEEISAECDGIAYDSDDRQGSRTGQSFVKLARILNVTSLSPTQAESVSQMAEWSSME